MKNHDKRLTTGTTLTGLRRLKPAFAADDGDEQTFAHADDKSTRKRRLGKEIALKQRKTVHYDDDSASEISLSYGSSSDHSSEDDVVVTKGISGVGTCLSHGFMSVIGKRREMEDSVAIELGFMTIGSRDYDFFGVYDGHGGSRVANSCHDRLHHLVVKEIPEEYKTSSYLGEEDWSRIMMDSFMKMDEEVNRIEMISENNDSFPSTIGSTAVVAVVGEDEVVIANCGDSRAVLSRGGVPFCISNDHKPDRSDELERIESAGGRVIDWNGHRVLGVLATSRSIGDHYLEPFVIAEPEVIVSKRTDADEFLILASDGLWDVVTNELACRVVKSCLDGRLLKWRCRLDTEKKIGEVDHGGGARAQVAAGLLVELAMSRGSRDNISVVVVDLNKACPEGRNFTG
ncbi:protein phosphatase 2C 51-like [Impatiens glandulifera]|uniref:protein phosphatase 2C 51-like n=1 Tax=Impatiens glandulifera TaxID=253017 RepID=UPI001FB0E721|nr:protein phosphatase 2C 51-like [Impatiens glandulifera]